MAGIDAFTVLMLHLDGANNDITTVDSEIQGPPKAITFAGTAKLSTGAAKFGATSLLVAGVTDFVSALDSADFNFGTGDFTLDCWVNYNTVDTTYQTVMGQDDGTNNNYGVFYKNPNNVSPNNCINITFTIGGVVKANYQTSALTVNTGQWYHYAVVRSGTSMLFFIDGVSQSLTTLTAVSTNNLGDIASVFRVGKDSGTSGFKGYIDEVRVSKGIARWTSNFTPPTSAYTIDGGNFTTMRGIW